MKAIDTLSLFQISFFLFSTPYNIHIIDYKVMSLVDINNSIHLKCSK